MPSMGIISTNTIYKLLKCTGSAIGFKLDSLLKLTDTRATNNKMTLMHFLCKVCYSGICFVSFFFDSLFAFLSPDPGKNKHGGYLTVIG